MKKETPMSKAVLNNYRNLAETMSKELARRGHVPFYCETAEEALAKVLELIPESASVGIPGTVTIRELGAVDALVARGNRVVHHWDPSFTPQQRDEARFEEMNCDALLVSSNAITKEGVLVNIDGSGNRVAAMCWSRGDRIFVVSMNKVCPDIESENGCVSPASLCRAVLITEQAPTMPSGKKSYVILVGEPLGY